MYSNSFLTNHLQKSSSVETKSKVVAEWNLNTFENIEIIGNYKNRPTTATDYNTTESNSAELASITYVAENANTVTPTWYGYTDYDITIDSGYTDVSQIPVSFVVPDERQKSLMSLEDCFKRFRPRSGINKLRFLNNNGGSIIPISGTSAFSRPRYYAGSKDDNFKYWSSFRENGKFDYGISRQSDRLILDAAPFIKYKNQVPTNKIVMKIQTNTSLIDKRNSTTNGKDPYWIGDTPNYKSTPEYWKIQKLNSNNVWEDVFTSTTDLFTSSAGWDGYFQLSYGLTNSEILTTYKNTFLVVGELSSTSALPDIQGNSFKGQSYLIKESIDDKGILYIYNGGTSNTVLDNYDEVDPVYGWYRSEESVSNAELFVNQLDKRLAPKYIEDGETVYREFDYAGGLRIVVNKMINKGTTFDLIELSPRLSVDLTDVTKSFSVKKFASDLGVSSLPVGQLIASTGNLSLFDDPQVFNQNNMNSLLNIYDDEDTLQISFVSKNLQVKFYEIIKSVRQGPSSSNYKDYYVPLKTLYSDGFPNYVDTDRTLEISLRDFSFFLESQIAPELLIKQASVSFIVATLLDSVGFSNYTFKRLDREKDVVIPYFMVASNRSVMQVLQDLAIATQTTMFFDEANNFVVMGKRWLVPDSKEDRDANITLYGSDNYVSIPIQTPTTSSGTVTVTTASEHRFQIGDVAVISNLVPTGYSGTFVVTAIPTTTSFSFANATTGNITTAGKVNTGIKTNIEEISSESSEIYNDGKIVYYNRYIQRGSNEITKQNILDKYQTFQYKDSVLWELDSFEKATQSKNEQDETSAGYVLSAIPLASTLKNVPPTVSSGEIINNVIDFADGAWWLSRYAGYLYSNGEIIKYDAIEYTIPSVVKVWIESNDEYQAAIASLPLGGKMYRTGRVRIYAEPNYNSNGTIMAGDVAKHGRGQFGTQITTHSFGVPKNSEWLSPKTPIVTDFQYLFKETTSTQTTNRINDNKTALSNTKMKPPKTTIKNFLSQPVYGQRASSGYIDYTGSVQASALVMKGPKFGKEENNGVSINYVKKEYSSKYDTFGTRLRILGDQKFINANFVKPVSTYEYDSFLENEKDKNAGILNASSGGFSIMTNSYGEGYYYEILSIDYQDTKALVKTNGAEAETLFFYKMEIVKKGYTTDVLSGTRNGSNTTLTATGGETLTFPGNTTGIATVNAGDILEIRNSSAQAGVWKVLNNGSGADPWKLERTIPVLKPTKLYSSFQQILSDTGKFTTKVLGKTELDDSIYDIAVKVNKVSSKKWIFHVFFNHDLIATIDDDSPITNGVSTNISLFTRGSSELMFDNVFAIDTINKNLTKDVVKSAEIFDNSMTSNISYSKHSLGPIIVGGFLSKISPSKILENQIYYEEFGTIMRECAYFNVKFDKTYPALRSIIAPVHQSISGYMVTGYTATPYRAEFLIFNTTDFSIDLGGGKDKGTSLLIQGVGFAQETAKDLTVDEFYGNKSVFGTNKQYTKNYKDRYTDIKNNRLAYGSKAFTIDSIYIQSEDTAKELMGYIIKKISKPRRAVGVQVFGMPIIQLGDLVNFYYDPATVLPNSVTDNNFVVYAIEHDTSEQGSSTMLYLSEVV